jgi:hypothetical protein
MNVAELSQDEILDALDEIIANTVSCINDHELGTDGCGGNVRQRVINCLEANEGKNNACAHCGPIHFPDFPSHDIVQRAIELIPNTNQEKINIQVAYSITTDILIIFDRIRIMSLRYGKDDGEIAECLERMKPYSLGSRYVTSKVKKITSLQKKAAALFHEQDPDKRTIKQSDFLHDFTREKKNLTDFRLKILGKIKECLSS